MVSLWGSKNGGKDDDEQQNGESTSVRESSSHSQSAQQRTSRTTLDDPNERTRLLQQHQVPGYLSPDDPAVSISRCRNIADNRNSITDAF